MTNPITAIESEDGCCSSVLVTPEQVNVEALPTDAVVLVVSDDCIKAVDAAQLSKGRTGIYVGDKEDPALEEMRKELYNAPS